MAPTDPSKALTDCLKWAYKGIESENDIRFIHGGLRDEIIRLVLDLRALGYHAHSQRKDRIEIFERWLNLRRPKQDANGYWCV